MGERLEDQDQDSPSSGGADRPVRADARRKLNVVSNAQAVAQAVRHALIPTI
jgi:LuxR family quorum-sensing system transcriptional regulator SinR